MYSTDHDKEQDDEQRIRTIIYDPGYKDPYFPDPYSSNL